MCDDCEPVRQRVCACERGAVQGEARAWSLGSGNWDRGTCAAWLPSGGSSGGETLRGTSAEVGRRSPKWKGGTAGLELVQNLWGGP